MARYGGDVRVTAGTQKKGAPVVPDTNVNIGIVKATELHIGTSGSETQVTATAAEINNACDVSTRLVSIANGTNTLALTAALHANRILLVLDATLAITLPEATGTGDIYTVVQGIAATSSTIVTADTANCGFHGFIMGSDTDAAASYNWVATGAQDTITFNGTSTGGKLYDLIRVTDIATDAWLLDGKIKQSGGSEATPLSSAA